VIHNNNNNINNTRCIIYNNNLFRPYLRKFSHLLPNAIG